MKTPTFTLPGIRWLGVLVFNFLFCAGATAQTLNTNPGPVDGTYSGRQIELIQIKAAENEAQQRQQTTDNERFLMDEWLKASPECLKNLVFLPVMPPALAAPRADLPVPPYPALLADYAGEIFFMPHGNLRLRRLLTSAQIQRIDQYAATRDQLERELRARLTAADTLPAETRPQALADFSRSQQPDLQKLEAEAESIRAEIAELDAGTALINLRDDPKYANAPAMRDYCSAILSAQFHQGLSLEQRLLLHEIALESLLGPDAPQPHAFFSPASARIRWPETTDAPLAGLRQRFQTLHQNLKAALKQTVIDATGNRSAARRQEEYAALARQQAPQFDELHRLAEQIRTALANLPDPDLPAPSALPAELIRQIGETVAHKNAFQAEATRLVKEAGRELAPAKLKLVFHDNQPVIEILPAEKPEAVDATVLARLRETNATLRGLHATLTAEMESARAATRRYHESLDPAIAPGLKALTASLAQTYAREAIWRRYHDYHAAVLTPGLSPAQRRLLFGAAQRDLEKHRLQGLN